MPAHIVKVSLWSPDHKVLEIRRAMVDNDILRSYTAFSKWLNSLFLQIAGKSYNLGWIDEEGDFIIMSSDAEIAEAVSNMSSDGIIRFSIYLPDSSEEVPLLDSSRKNENCPKHPSSTCAACDVPISGIRYACMVCLDYNLCSSCNAQDKHPHHNMFKYVNPQAFPGAIQVPALRRGFATNNMDSKLSKGCVVELAKAKKMRAAILKAEEALVRLIEKQARTKAAPALPKDEESFQTVDGWTLLENMNEEAIKNENGFAGGLSKDETKVKEFQTEKNDGLKAEELQAEKKEETKANDCQSQEGKMQAEGMQAEEKETKAKECQMQKKDENIMCNESQAEADQKPAQPPRDPVLEEALLKMQGMGFSNDGGWLENLLRTRQGNINAVLDLLYPCTSEQ